MEEDIKFIRKYMQDYFYEDIAIEDDFKFEKAIEHLLQAYKEDEAVIEELVNYIIKEKPNLTVKKFMKELRNKVKGEKE